MGLGYFRKARPHGRPSLRHGAARALLAALALVLVPAQAFAQSDDEVVDARAVVLVSGTLAKIQDMDFGQIAQPSIAGTVTLSPTPIPTCGTTGGLVRTGPCEAAEFAIMGRKNDLARVRELNSGVVTLTGPGGATMTMTNISIGVSGMVAANGGGNPVGNLGRFRITTDSGIGYFRLGGRLNVNANQAPGLYDGTLEIQVVFN